MSLNLRSFEVALAAGVYVWNAADGSIVQLCQREGEEEYVSSVSWIAQVGLENISTRFAKIF